MEDTGDIDDRILQDLGYKPELIRGFGCLMNFTFYFTAVAVISSISGLFPTAIHTGGPAIMMWSWIGVSVFTILVALSLAEICLTYPSAGSVYYWAGALASAERAPVVSLFHRLVQFPWILTQKCYFLFVTRKRDIINYYSFFIRNIVQN